MQSLGTAAAVSFSISTRDEHTTGKCGRFGVVGRYI